MIFQDAILPDLPMFEERVLRSFSNEQVQMHSDIQREGLNHQRLLNKIALDRRFRA